MSKTFKEMLLENSLEEARLAVETTEIALKRNALDVRKAEAEVARVKEQRVTTEAQLSEHKDKVQKLEEGLADFRKKQEVVQAQEDKA